MYYFIFQKFEFAVNYANFEMTGDNRFALGN